MLQKCLIRYWMVFSFLLDNQGRGSQDCWLYSSRNEPWAHSISWKLLKFDGPTVSINPLMETSGTLTLFPCNSWSMKTTTTVISSWKKRLIPFSTFWRSLYLISLFLAASFKAVLRSRLAIPWCSKDEQQTIRKTQ